MKNKFLIGIICFISGIAVACAPDVKAGQTQDGSIKIWFENRNGQMETFCVVDEKTGVNYIVVAPSWKSNCNTYDGVTITPRLNADGTLYCTK